MLALAWPAASPIAPRVGQTAGANVAPDPQNPCATPRLIGKPVAPASDLPVELRADALFDAYMAADQRVIERTLTTGLRFDHFRRDFLQRVLAQWVTEPRRPDRAAFMLDVAIVAFNKSFQYWLDFIEEGRRYLAGRPEPPGRNPALDAFEVLWHKTSIGVLSAARRPDYLAGCSLDWLKNRMAPEPLASGEPRLVDPWIALARGYSEEAFTIVNPEMLDERGAAAIGHYDRAATYADTRAEATVRKAWLLIRLRRPGDALATLDTFDERWTADPAVLYWGRLFRGLAYQRLDRQDDATRAYESALALAPGAQTPKVALLTIELQRGRPDAAAAQAAAVRTESESNDDPFWAYPFGDRRLLSSRMEQLRKAARQ